MVIIRLLRPGLLLYEVIRVLILAIYSLIEPVDYTGFPRFVFIVSGAVFPIMALFIWIDIDRYKAYIPLFIAGKCVNLLPLLILCFSMNLKLAEGISQPGAELNILLLGDLFAMAGILLIKKYKDKLTKTQVLEDK
ncbi:MAG: hypothetical protein FWC03_03840 [Treponema sp.]|nr:hypothetical protein [Treponema sp.]